MSYAWGASQHQPALFAVGVANDPPVPDARPRPLALDDEDGACDDIRARLNLVQMRHLPFFCICPVRHILSMSVAYITHLVDIISLTDFYVAAMGFDKKAPKIVMPAGKAFK